MLQNQLNAKNEENTSLKTKLSDVEAKLSNARERIETMTRDVKFKVDQLRDLDARMNKMMDELDLTKYKLQDN